MTGDFPYRLTARYADVYSNSTSLPVEQYRGKRLGRAFLPRLEGELRQFGRPRFVVVSPGQQRYATLYGHLEPGSLRKLGHALDGSPSFHRVYRRGPAAIYEDVRARSRGEG